MNFYQRHLGDYCKNAAHLSLLEHGVYVRLMDVYYARESAIPENMVARLIGARTEPETQALQVVLQEFFVLRNGHYHQDRCDQEIKAFLADEPTREAKQENEQNRLQRHRNERAKLFKTLASAGVHADWNTKMEPLREMVAALQLPSPETVSSPLQATSTETPATFPATATATPLTATHYPLPNTQLKEKSARNAVSTEVARAEGQRRSVPDETDPEVPAVTITPAGLICRAMRRSGMADVNPGDPRLLELIKQGATEEEFVGMATEAVSKGKGFAWTMVALINRRAEAAAIALAPKVTTHINGEVKATQAYLAELDAHRSEPTPEEKAAVAEKLRLARERVTTAHRNAPPAAGMAPP